MKSIGKVLVVVSACIVSGSLGWYFFKPKSEGTSEQIYHSMAMSIGVDPSLWEKVGSVLNKATSTKHQDLSSEDYALLYQALATGKPGAQRPALMAISRCPPPDKDECFIKVNAVAKTADDPDVQIWAYGFLWNEFPDKHPVLLAQSETSPFSQVPEEMKTWPAKLTKH